MELRQNAVSYSHLHGKFRLSYHSYGSLDVMLALMTVIEVQWSGHVACFPSISLYGSNAACKSAVWTAKASNDMTIRHSVRTITVNEND